MDEEEETNVQFGHELVGDEDGGHLGLFGGVFECVLTESGIESDEREAMSEGGKGREQPFATRLGEDQNRFVLLQIQRHEATTNRLDLLPTLVVRQVFVVAEQVLTRQKITMTEERGRGGGERKPF